MKRSLIIVARVLLLAVLLAGAFPAIQSAHAEGEVTAQVKSSSVNIRSGPGVAYPTIGSLKTGTVVDVIGIHPASGWLKINFIDAVDAWITGGSDYVTVTGSLDVLTKVVDVPPPPVVAQPQSGPNVNAAAPVVAKAAIATPQPPSGREVNAAAPVASTGEGKLVFQTASGGEIYLINADGTGLRKLTTGLDPSLSPDGSKVAFARWEGIPRGLYVINVDGSGERLVYGFDKAGGVKAPSWSPDGQRIAFIIAPGDDTRFQACFQFKVPTPGGAKKFEQCFFGPRHQWWKISTVNLDGSDYKQLLTHNFSFSPSWAPDGDRIAYASDQGMSLTGENDAEGNTHADPHDWQLTDYQGDRSPAWSPGGHRIAFQTKSHDHWEIVVINDDAKGRNQLTRSWPLADVPVNSVSPAWSPDANWIVYLTDERGKWELWRMRSDGSEKAPFLEEALKDIRFRYESVDERVVSWGK